MIPLTIPEKIMIVRRRLGESQQVFGERFKVKQLTVTQWERGEFNPRPEHLSALNEIFRDMLGEEDDSKTETAAFQLLLPFDQPVQMDLRVFPSSAKAVRCAIEIKRKIS